VVREAVTDATRAAVHTVARPDGTGAGARVGRPARPTRHQPANACPAGRTCSGFRGHVLTKSQRYSTTFGAIRDERRTRRRREALAQLGRETDDPGDIPIDLDTVTVVNDWTLVHIGHRNHAERELAVAIAERNRHQRRSTTRQRSAA
jgi:hypothetical protein